MKGQVALEFLYTNALIILIALVVISLIMLYFSNLFSFVESCNTSYFLNCESFYVSRDQNNINITMNITNNFDYDVIIKDIEIDQTNYSINKNIPARQNEIIKFQISNYTDNTIDKKFIIHYSPQNANLNGLINGILKALVNQ